MYTWTRINHRPLVRRLAAALALVCLYGCASAPQGAPDAITSDPVALDAAFPAASRAVTIMSRGSPMNGRVLMAQGAGPHPTVLLLHGLPGIELNFDIAHSIRRAGWNVVTFHYRGSWGSGGEYSIRNAIEDVGSAMTYIRGSAATPATRTDAANIVIIGHSVGGFAGLTHGAGDPAVKAIAAISPADVGLMGQRFGANPEARGRALNAFSSGTSIKVSSPEQFVQDWIAAGPELGMPKLAGRLAKKSLLVVGSKRDVVTPMADHYTPLVSALRTSGATDLTEAVMDSDHSYSDHRIALSRAVLSWLAKQR